MTYSPRTFILAEDDTLYRLASTRFSRKANKTCTSPDPSYSAYAQRPLPR
jgi:hypothetical protein